MSGRLAFEIEAVCICRPHIQRICRGTAGIEGL